MGCTTFIRLLTSHGAWIVQCSTSHGPWVVQHFLTHGSWAVQHFTFHGSWIVQHLNHQWGMGCTMLYLPWVMGCTTLSVPMAHGLYNAVRTRSDTTPVNSDQLLTWYVSPSFSFTLVLVPHFVCSPVVPPSDYAPLVGTPVPFRMLSRVSVVLRNSGLLLVVVYLGPAPDSFGVLAAYAVFIM